MLKHFQIVLYLLAASTIFAIYGCGPAVETGAITGTLVGEVSGEPLAGATIILASLKESRENGDLYELLASPLAVTDSDGSFSLEAVPVGTYLLVHSCKGELKAEPNDLEGIEIENLRMKFDQANLKFMMSNEGKFWEGGVSGLGEQGMITTANALNLHNGSVRSNSLGITIMAVDSKLSPVVKVAKDETAKVDWKVKGR
jgi:hypothetical protein